MNFLFRPQNTGYSLPFKRGKGAWRMPHRKGVSAFCIFAAGNYLPGGEIITHADLFMKYGFFASLRMTLVCHCEHTEGMRGNPFPAMNADNNITGRLI